MSYSQRWPFFAIAIALGAGCGGLRFRDQPVVWSVDDERAIHEPEEREYFALPYFADLFALRRLERAMALRDLEPAWNVNALEEVPDSTWFENRLGRREMTPQEIARGPDRSGPPRPPYVVKSGKFGGGAPGFVMEDANGRSFLMKFDRPENPEMQTGSNLVVNRVFWAIGYHVPADYVIELRPEELSIGPKAQAKDEMGEKIPYTTAMLDGVLAGGPPPRNGAYRATASEYLPGVPKGGWPPEGVRADDPNDVVPHEHRRELRGLRVASAWMNHTDMKEDNTLDMYVDEGNKRFLRHYLVDFGEALGGHGAEKNRKEDGYEHYWDWEHQPKAALTFGMWTRPWEDLKPSGFLAFGTFGTNVFDPKLWREAYPYWPFMEMDATDAFWAAKIIVKVTRAHLQAIVHEARFSEPGAAQYLVDVLEKRKIAIGRAYLEALSALDDFEMQGGRLCATDVGVKYGVVPFGILERLDDGEVAESIDVGPQARACVTPKLADGYNVVELRSRRGDQRRPPLEVHIRGGAEPRVIGIVRDP